MSAETKPDRAPRIKDVALQAGVSTATVSRTLAEPASVRPQLRARVMEAVRALGYTPNAAARSLRAGQTRTVLVLTRKRWSAPFFSEVLRGIDDALGRAGYSMILANFDGEDGSAADGREPAMVDMMFSGHIDGAIVLSGRVAKAGGRSMLDAGLPVVSICAAVEGTPAVLTDEAEGIVGLAAHLAREGHADFLYVSGPEGNYNERVRRAALERFFAARPDCRFRVTAGDFSMEAGAAAAGRFLGLARRPTAVICCSDDIAVGFMKAVRAGGLRVPADVSVAGFDGIEFADFCEPTLTTVSQPRFDLGRTGAERLLAALAGAAEASAGPIVLPSTLRVAASTGPAPSRAAVQTSSPAR